ncbi:MAG: hypothetical protein U0805_10715 [Pirellulales bacterium]
MAKKRKRSVQASKPEHGGTLNWPAPFASVDQLPDPKTLVIAWKPVINGWDIVLGRKVIEAPSEYTHWLPMIPQPE